MKPNLSFMQLWNLSFGFLGVQIGYSLQNANTSRILQSLGADVHELSYFWLAAPLAGLVVQPIVGLFSDRTWTPLGRRIPFILGGSFLAAAALFLMPQAEAFVHLMPALFFAGMMLLFMDMAFNVTMQPFRAMVADMVNDSQRTKGYAIQTFLINIGAVIGSVLPYILVNVFGMTNVATEAERVPQSVAWAYYIGGAVLLLSVLVTTFFTKEYAPAQYAHYNGMKEADKKAPSFFALLRNTPGVMLQLGVVQFFSWFALFLMWTYTTPAVSQNLWGTIDTQSAAYGEASDWVGVLFAVYSVFSALFSLVIVWLADRIGNKLLYSISLMIGALGFLGIVWIDGDLMFASYTLAGRYLLILPMIGVGIAWAAILAMPYAILSKSLPSRSMGVYMGIFNFTITIPQIVSGLIGGVLVKTFFSGNAVPMIALAGISLFMGGITVFIVKEKNNCS